MSAIITVANLGKQYRIGAARKSNSFRDLFDEKMRALFSSHKRGQVDDNIIWALRDVSFEVQEGEVLGIIGRNGAGKSTLLKILSRITEPTEGIVRMKGRVASLLEVGTGFSGELTGRENIFLNGAILGLRNVEIKYKFDEIVTFAELEDFIDTPVKKYSSGMYMRLAFAVAAHLDPEILIIDEVLAVGDAQFQKKCLGKMEEVGKKGRTILFVSHNMDAVSRLCGRSILLKKGSIACVGETNKVIASYVESAIGLTNKRRWDESEALGNENVCVLEVLVHDIKGASKYTYELSETVEISIKYRILTGDNILQPAVNIVNAMGLNIFDSHDTNLDWRRTRKRPGIYLSTVAIPGNLLTEGVYLVGVAVLTPDPFYVHVHEKEIIAFAMVDTHNEISSRGDYVGNFPGIIRPLLPWRTKQLENI